MLLFFFHQLRQEIKVRHEDENRRSAVAQYERSVLREQNFLRSQQKTAEREELKSRREFCRSAMMPLVENPCHKKSHGRSTQSKQDSNSIDDKLEMEEIANEKRSAEEELEQVLRKLENTIATN